MKHSINSAKKKSRKTSAGSDTSRRGRQRPVRFPIVGVGASAGGLEAVTQLLQSLPVDTGMAFVLLQHLDPKRPSALTGILSKVSALPVSEVTRDMAIEPNHFYVIPPNANLAVKQGVLKLHPREESAGSLRSIDFFLESLAQDQRDCAIGIVLSGAASDGTIGLEAIKAEGGITFAQDESAKYDSMPRSAIAAGCVDFVLPPEQMGRELARIAKHPLVARAADAVSSTKPEKETKEAEAASRAETFPADAGFRKILILLRNHSGVDFSPYKSSTILRRINRRMVLNRLETFETYARFLRENPKELESLYSDVLINVTGFFRNLEAFDVLKRAVFPKLVPGRRDEPVRFWVLGCSTGQEAYSLAMAFTEFCDRLPRAPKLQIFATDLNDALLDKARAGLYVKSVMQDVSPERLRRFFVEQEGGYRVIKPLRETVVFARQNLLSDPPFSRMDLITCRNLLIYIEAGLQKKVIPTFHYALRPKGFLFLGASESVGQFTDLFEAVDKKHKIYSQKPGPTPALQARLHSSPTDQKREITWPGLPGAPEASPPELNAQREADRIARNRYAPPGVLVNAELQILQFRGDTGPYLKPAAGQASFNVLKMAREGLMLPLRTALNQAKKENKLARLEKLSVKQDGHSRATNLEVVPLKNLKERCYLISFEDVTKRERANPAAPSQKPPQPKDRTPTTRAAEAVHRRVLELEEELNETRDHLQSLQEQSEAAHEELQASNEEITSANEELQSLNEELETSKEELESANEELTTVNEEMANRNVELGRLNSDLTNLLSSSRLAVLLLGRDLTVRRFSAQAEKQFNLLAADVGRPIGNVRHDLDVSDLEDFIGEVIRTVRADEREVRDNQGRWYSLRIHPYITVDNRVDGAVLLLVDIDPLKRREQEIAVARDYAANIVQTVHEALLVLDADLRVESANSSFYSCFHITAAGTEGKRIYELDNGQWDIPELRRLLEEILPKHRSLENYEVERDFNQLGRRTMLLNARRIEDPSWLTHRILLAIEDITDRKEAEQELRHARIAETILATARDPLLILEADLRIHSANAAFYRTFKTSPVETEHKSIFEVGDDRWRVPGLCALLREVIPRNSFFDNFEVSCDLGMAGRRTFLLNARMLKGTDNRILLGMQDITEVLQFQSGYGQSEARQDARHAFASEAIITLDREGKIVEFDSIAEKILGYPRAEVIDKPLAGLIIPEPVREEGNSGLAQCLSTAEGPVTHRQIELPALRADGAEFTAQLSIAAIPGTQPRLFTAILRDMSEVE